MVAIATSTHVRSSTPSAQRGRVPAPRAHWRVVQGQALVLGLFLLVLSVSSIWLLFNTGQLIREKTHLVNTADAVAHGAAQLQARALNFDAYTNRALIANEVLMAQMVTMASWSRFAATHLRQLPALHPECLSTDFSQSTAGALFKYGLQYSLLCHAVGLAGVGNTLASSLDPVADITQPMVKAIEFNKTSIQLAQQLLHQEPWFDQLRQQLMQELANAHMPPGEPIVVSELPNPDTARSDDWARFTRRYAEQDRTRMADVVMTAAQREPFVAQRSWTASAMLPTPECFPALAFDRYNEVRRRGATALVGLDEWRAVDTESFHRWELFLGKWTLPSCEQREYVHSATRQHALPTGRSAGDSPLDWGGSRSDNPIAHAGASSQEWSGYSGLPVFRDLADSQLAQPDPRLRVAVKLSRPRAALHTHDAQLAGAIDNGQNPRGPTSFVDTALADEAITAVSAAEVYFARPAAFADNRFGLTSGRSGEWASLFNPYWRAHLVSARRDAAQQRQTLWGEQP